jgi:hypothetical protein
VFEGMYRRLGSVWCLVRDVWCVSLDVWCDGVVGYLGLC